MLDVGLLADSAYDVVMTAQHRRWTAHRADLRNFPLEEQP